MKNAIGMSFETYWRLAQFGFIAVIVAVQIPAVRQAIGFATYVTWVLIRNLFQFYR